MVNYNMSLEEIQDSVQGYKIWTKFGSKVGDPFLSIFNEDIKRAVAQIEYEPGKSYNFTDGEYEYKIDVEKTLDQESPKFTFFIKPKMVASSYKKQIKSDNNFIDKYLLMGTILFVLIGFFILLIGGVFQALLG